MVAVTAVPAWVTVAFQLFTMDWPPDQVHFTVQPVIELEPAVTFTLALKPLPQLLEIVIVAVQVPGAPVPVAVAVAVGVPVGLLVGVPVGVVVRVGVLVGMLGAWLGSDKRWLL